MEEKRDKMKNMGERERAKEEVGRGERERKRKIDR